jgi:integrase
MEIEDLVPKVGRDTPQTDGDLLALWLKNYDDGSAHTLRVYKRVGERFLAALGDVGLRRANEQDIQSALDAMRIRADGEPVKDATVNTYFGALKSFLRFAHRVGYIAFKAAPLIELKKMSRRAVPRILSELEARKLIDAAKPGRDRLMFETAYHGRLRISDLLSLQWGRVSKRDNGEAQLEIVGDGDTIRKVLIPLPVATNLLSSRGDTPDTSPVFESVRNPGNALTERTVNLIIKAAARRAGVNPAASARWLQTAHASHSNALITMKDKKLLDVLPCPNCGRSSFEELATAQAAEFARWEREQAASAREGRETPIPAAEHAQHVRDIEMLVRDVASREHQHREQKPRVRRATKASATIKHVWLRLKITSVMRTRLDHAARASGRTLRQEAEVRIERSFDRQDLLPEVLRLAYGKRAANLLMRLGPLISDRTPRALA